MNMMAIISLMFTSLSFASPEVLVKGPQVEENIISMTVFGAYASKHTPFYTRVFKSGAPEKSYVPMDVPFKGLNHMIPCILDELPAQDCKKEEVPKIEELDSDMISLLMKCAPRIFEFETIDFKINSERTKIIEVRLPVSCRTLVN